MSIKCIIVDDEPLAHVVLEKYIAQIQNLELLANCKNALEALNFLHTNTVDLIFLDINMPDLSGIELLKTLKYQPKIIFTTAYSEFALEGYEYGATDYLLKPIKFERFLKAVNRAFDTMEPKQEKKEEPVQEDESKQNHIFLKQDQSVLKVMFSDINYVEAYGNYVQVYTTDQKIITRQTMTEIEKALQDENFLRVHKSYIVNITKIDKIHNNQIHICDKEISIGTIYKSELMKKLNL